MITDRTNLRVVVAFLIFFLAHSLINANFWVQNFIGAVLLTLFIKSSSRRVSPQDKSDIEYPPVSIIIPMRNEEKNVILCLSSLVSLDYPQYEIIIGNDSSTDKTREAVLRFKRRI